MFYRVFTMIAWAVARRVAPWAGRRVKDKLAGNDDQPQPAAGSNSASKPASGTGKKSSSVSDAKPKPAARAKAGKR